MGDLGGHPHEKMRSSLENQAQSIQKMQKMKLKHEQAQLQMRSSLEILAKPNQMQERIQKHQKLNCDVHFRTIRRHFGPNRTHVRSILCTLLGAAYNSKSQNARCMNVFRKLAKIANLVGQFEAEIT